MSTYTWDEEKPRSRKILLVCALLALTVLFAAMAGGAYYWWSSQEVGVVAYISVEVNPPLSRSEGLYRQPAKWVNDEDKNSLLTMITAPSIIRSALQRTDVRELQIVRAQGSVKEAERWLEESLVVEYPAGGKYMKIMLPLRGDVDELSEILQAVVDEFVAEQRHIDTERHSEAIEHLRDVIERRESAIAKKLRRLKARRMLDDTGQSMPDPETVLLQQEVDVELETLRKFQAALELEEEIDNLQPARVRIAQPALPLSDSEE